MSFSKMQLNGLENIPDYDKSIVIFAPNHCAAALDPLLLLQIRRYAPIAFGARSDIFAKPRLAKILRWLHILPVARERNGIHEVAKNFDTFDEAIECMEHGTPFCLFAEGTHRPERGMMPVKKGIFRIAKLAVERSSKPVYVVPVGLDYEYFFHEIGRVAVNVGKPINVGEFYAAHKDDMVEAEIYKALCNLLRERDLELIGHVMKRRHDRKLGRAVLGLASLPLFALCAAVSIPIWLPAEIVMAGFKDKAWTHTVYYAMRFFWPILWPFQWLACVLLNLYRELFNDLKRK